MSALGPDDIAAFASENEAAMKAALEFARRAEKGLPPDRFADGNQGAIQVARGIRAWFAYSQICAGAFLQIYNETKRASEDAVRIHHEDSGYSE